MNWRLELAISALSIDMLLTLLVFMGMVGRGMDHWAQMLRISLYKGREFMSNEVYGEPRESYSRSLAGGTVERASIFYLEYTIN